MSDATTATATATGNGGQAPIFTEREQALLGVAMAHCLKSGPPEIDYQKFMEHGNFNTMKTAQNTWGKIKAKLASVAGKGKGDEEEGGIATPKTPKSTKKPQATTPGSKKRGKKGDDTVVADPDDDGEESGSPKKKRKTTPKKTVKKEESDEEVAPAADDE